MTNRRDDMKAHGYVGDFGLVIDRLIVPLSQVDTNDKSLQIELINNHIDLSGKILSRGVNTVSVDNGVIVIDVYPFLYRSDFMLKLIYAHEEYLFSKPAITNIDVEGANNFKTCEENGVNFRLYEPDSLQPRPLVLFLHGGGECGQDNISQLTGTMGAISLARRWSDMYILAPQAPDGGLTMAEAFATMKKRGDPFTVDLGNE